jgi:DUF1009 family protein
LRAIALEADKTLLLEKESVVALAAQKNISIVGR